jgi:ubiquitin-protein ligase
MPKGVNVKRLVKNFKDFNAEGEKEGITAEFNGDDMFHWIVKIRKFPKDSQVDKDMGVLHEKFGTEYAIFHIEFQNETAPFYPFAPPFVWIESPTLTNEHSRGSYNNNGEMSFGSFGSFNGVFCSEILTPKNWNPVYTPFGIISQFITLMDLEKVGFVTNKETKYQVKNAKDGYKKILRYHPEWNIKK